MSPRTSPKPQNAPAWLSRREAAAHVGMSVDSIDRAIEAGHLPAYRAPGGHAIRIRRDDLDGMFTRVPAGGSR